MKHLRDYQRQAIADLITRWDAGATRVPLVLATGLGKTEIFTALESQWVEQLHEAYGLGKRVLVLAHTDELIEQAARKARQRNPHLTVGIVKAGLNEAHAQIVVSSRQTLQSERRRAQIKNVGLIIVDEAHHALRSNTYGKILEHFGAFGEINPTDQECPQHGEYCACVPPASAKVAGFTATLARGDKGKLSTVWEECTFRRDILFGIRHGYLLDVRGERVVVPDFDLTKVKKVAGDFSDSGLAEELERTFAPEIIAKKYAEVAVDGAGRLRAGIAFWPLVETAYHGAEAFEGAGISSAVIHGGLPKEERRLILKRFAAGEVTVIHNCMVLTEGFDAPWADVVVVARPTQSAPLYQQMVGRVLRPDLTVPAEQREKALILDVVGAARQHDLRSLIDLTPERPLRADEDQQLSLLELDDLAIQDEERRQTAAVFDDPTAEPYLGDTVTVAFDPLHREKLWAQTPGGTFYISAGTERYIFLTDSIAGDPGTVDVVWASKRAPGPAGFVSFGTDAKGEDITCSGLPLDEALLVAEDAADEMGGYGTKTLTSRKAQWRKQPPTHAQLNEAYRNGIAVPMRDGCSDRMATPETSAWSKGEISERIDEVKAARRIDALVEVTRKLFGNGNGAGE